MIRNITICMDKFTKRLAKTLSLFIVVMLVSNCIISSFLLNCDKSDLAEISSIQKDVFSAIFLISGTIEKINASVSDKLGLGTSKTTNDENKIPQPVSNSSNDIIITSSQNQNTKILKNFYDFYATYDIREKFCNTSFLYDKKIVSQAYCLYFIIMLLFFSSATKLYNNLNKKNNLYLKPTVV